MSVTNQKDPANIQNDIQDIDIRDRCVCLVNRSLHIVTSEYLGLTRYLSGALAACSRSSATTTRAPFSSPRTWLRQHAPV
jgi:hypothetical protein